MRTTICTLILALFFTISRAQDCDIATSGVTVVNATNTATIGSIYVGEQANFKFSITNAGTSSGCVITPNTVTAVIDFPTIAGPTKPYIYNGPPSFISGYFTWTYNSGAEALVGTNTTAIPQNMGDLTVLVPVLGNAVGTGNSNLNLTQGAGISNGVNNDVGSAQLSVLPMPLAACDIATSPITVVNAANTVVTSICVGQQANFKFSITNAGTVSGCSIPPNSVTAIFDFPILGGPIRPYIYNGPASFVSGYFTWTYNSMAEVLIGTNTIAIPNGAGDNVSVPVLGNMAGTGNSNVNLSQGLGVSDDVSNDFATAQLTVFALPSDPLITATNSTCQPGCMVGGGSFNIVTSCGAGTVLTYYSDASGSNPTTTAPVYNQTTAMTIYYACVNTTTGCRSAIQTLTTNPGSCTTPSAPSITATNSTCQPGCTVGGGSFNIVTSCGSGTVLTYYSDASGSNPTTTAPVYNQTTAMTIYYACVNTTTGCRSAIQTLTTNPGSCTTPSTPSITATNSTCQPGCTVGGGSFNIVTSCGAGTVLTYYSDASGSNPTTTAPVYNQTTAMTIYYACVNTTTGCRSAIQTLTTNPGSCTTPSTPSITATNSTCQPGCTVGGGSFNIVTSCGAGTVLTYYSDASGSNPTTTAPVYNQTTAMTIYYACVNTTTGCRSAIQTLTTNPGSCTTPSTPSITATNSTCQPGCTLGGGSFNIVTSCGAGTVLTYYSDASGSNPTTTAPVYNQATAMTIYYACVNTTTGCRSTIQTLTTNPGTCTAPTVTCPGNSSVPSNTPPYTLTGATPATGTYSGDGVSSNQFNPAAAGVGPHTITYNYSDGNGCTGTCTFTITVTPSQNVSCPPNFSVCIGATPFALMGANPPGGTYSGDGVSGGLFSPAVAGVGPHTITYSYFDGSSTSTCTFVITVLSGPTAGIINNTGTTVLTCSVNSITVTATGGVNYSWSNGSMIVGTSAMLTITAPGTYTVTVTAANGCSATATITITQTGLTVNAGPDTDICNGPVVLTATVTGGVTSTPAAPVTFGEASGSTSDKRIFVGNIDYITLGNTFSQSEDRNNCNKNTSASATLTLPAGAVVKKAYLYWSGSGSLDNTVKLNGNSVTADATKTYSRSGGFYYFGARKDVTGLVTSSGTYTVTDLSWSNGSPYCYDNSAYGGWAMAVVYELASLPASKVHINSEKFEFTYPADNYSTTINNINVPTGCNPNAKLTIVAFEGDNYKGEGLTIGGQSFGDNNFRGQSGPNLDILTWSIPALVTPATNSLTYCISTYQSNTVFGPAIEGLFDYVKVLKYNYCPSGCNGLTYQWTKNGTMVGTGQSITVSIPGTYVVKVTDCAGCVKKDTVIVAPCPALCNISLTASVTNVSCKNGSNGAINLAVSGATAPLTYDWSNGAHTEDLSVLTAGTYTVIVTDKYLCVATKTITVTEPATSLSVSSSVGTIACNGGSTTVTISASGGTPPYYGTGTFTRSAGTCSFTVTDSKGCTKTIPVTVTEPSPLIVTATAPIIPCGGTTTTVTVSASGGTSPYNGTGAFTKGPGTWTFTVTDANGCSCSKTIVIANPNCGPCVPDKCYKLIARHSGKALTVENSSTSDGGNVEQRSYNGNNNQKWQFDEVESGWYRVINVHSGKVLDVAGASTSNGANIQQWTWNSGNNQKWSLTNNSGYYVVKAKHSGKAMSVAGSSTSNGADVEQRGNGNNYNEQWTISEVGCPNATRVAEPVTKITDDDDQEEIVVITEKKVESKASPKKEEAARPAKVEADLKVTVHPNPTIGYFSLVTSSNDAMTPVDVRIFDVNSKTIWSRFRREPNGSLRIETDTWAGGVYFIEVSQGADRKVIKLIKAN